MPNYAGKRKGTRRIVVWKNGKPHEKTIRGSKVDGDLFEAKWRVQLEANQHDSRAVMTFAKLCAEKYSHYAEGHLAKSTWRARSHVIVNLVEFFGEKALDSFRLSDIDAYRAHRKKIGASTRNTEVMTLLYILRWAEARGYRVTVPKAKLEKPPRGRPRIWSAEQVARLLEVTRTHDPWLLPIVLFLLNTGCRKGEAIAAEWSWVDFDAGLIRIPATREWSPKSGAAREVPLSDTLRAVLSGGRRSERWVFPNRDGYQFEHFPNQRFKDMQNLAGVTWGPHTCRHVFASTFLANGGSMFKLSKILGHSHERISALYSHLLPGHLEEERNRVNIAPTMGIAETTMGAQSRKPA